MSLYHHITTPTNGPPNNPLRSAERRHYTVPPRPQYTNRPNIHRHASKHTSHNLVSLQQHNVLHISGYCDVPWIGQDSSKLKDEEKLVPVNATKAQDERTSS
jgi:hypothetical protein